MERRALATWEAQYPGPYDGVRVVSRPETCDDYLARTGMDFERFADILVGDTTRMERYAALGYQSDQAPLPTPVRTALDALIRLGYDRHLPEK